MLVVYLDQQICTALHRACSGLNFGQTILPVVTFFILCYFELFIKDLKGLAQGQLQTCAGGAARAGLDFD